MSCIVQSVHVLPTAEMTTCIQTHLPSVRDLSFFSKMRWQWQERHGEVEEMMMSHVIL